MLRMAMILTLMLLASTAYASAGSVGIDIIGSNVGNTIVSQGAGSVNMDIVGSKTGNAQISSNGAVSADVEVVGSETGDITISSKTPVYKTCCYSDVWYDYTRPLCYPYSAYIPARYNTPISYPYVQYQHSGVDAWHGSYWYSPTYLPKWPQI